MATLTVNPDSGTGGTTTDASLQEAKAGWVNLRAGADPFITAQYVGIIGDSGDWLHLFRSIFTFDTSPIPAGATITRAVLTLTGSGVSYNQGSLTAVVVKATPADVASIATSDWAQWVATAWSDTLVWPAPASVGTQFSFELNAAGMAGINLAGITSLMVMLDADRANSDPGWASNQLNYFQFYMAETYQYAPELYIEYTPAPTTNTPALFGRTPAILTPTVVKACGLIGGSAVLLAPTVVWVAPVRPLITPSVVASPMTLPVPSVANLPLLRTPLQALPRTIYASAGNVGRSVRLELKNKGGGAIPLRDSPPVTVYVVDQDGNLDQTVVATIDDADLGVISFIPNLSTAGQYDVEIKVAWGTSFTTIVPSRGTITLLVGGA